MPHPDTVTVNERQYRWPQEPVVVVCLDGSEPEYTERAMADGLMPNLRAIIAGGENLRAQSVIPSFTNPNNLSIVTGRPPAVHGICGNYLIDPETGEEVMMNDPRFLRAPTLFAAFHDAGARVAVITAKDKLRTLLGNGLDFSSRRAIAFSSEKADQCTLADNGIEDVCGLVGMAVPDVYSPELSEFVMAAGVRLLATFKPDLMYLSTTDYVQHKYPPGSAGANSFYAMMDRYFGLVDAAGARLVITADHGMKDKRNAAGEPDIIYLQDVLDDWLGAGRARVILPITDPYVAHHGALGSFATVYLADDLDAGDIAARIGELDGVDVAVTREEGCRRFELPPERTGDVIVVSGGATHSKVIGKSPAAHDLSSLNGPLRSHGGLSEQTVPMIVNRKVGDAPAHLRNFDAFAIACNHAMARAGEPV